MNSLNDFVHNSNRHTFNLSFIPSIRPIRWGAIRLLPICVHPIASSSSASGIGFSSGPRTPEDFVIAAKLVVDFVVEKTNKAAEEILMVGHSMGGAIAVITANQIKSKRLILINPLDALANCVIDGCVMTGFVGGTRRV